MKTSGFTQGAGAFFVLVSVFLAAILMYGRDFPEWGVAVGIAFISSVSIVVSLTAGQRSCTSQSEGAEE